MNFNLIIHRTALPILSAAVLCALLWTGCSKDVRFEEELVEITPSVDFGLYVDAETKAPLDGSLAYTLNFARADETSSGNYGSYGSSFTGSIVSGIGVRNLTFSSTQYYLPNGLNTKIAGWYPAGTYSGGVVSWTFDGSLDILTASAKAGTKSSAMPSFTFAHQLTQLQFYVYAENSASQTYWGNVTGITINNQPNNCTYTLADNDTDGLVAFTGNTAINVSNITSTLPLIGSENASAVGDPVMFAPRGANQRLEITITTSNGRSITTKLPATAFNKGQNRIIYLNFSQGFITTGYEDNGIINWE